VGEFNALYQLLIAAQGYLSLGNNYHIVTSTLNKEFLTLFT
jgi:hypothetical protein